MMLFSAANDDRNILLNSCVMSSYVSRYEFKLFTF